MKSAIELAMNRLWDKSFPSPVGGALGYAIPTRTIWKWGSSPGAQYHFLAITPRSTLTPSVVLVWVQSIGQAEQFNHLL